MMFIGFKTNKSDDVQALKDFLHSHQRSGVPVIDSTISKDLLSGENEEIYWEFLKMVVPSLVKMTHWKRMGPKYELSKILFVHEEAFALLALENAYKSILDRSDGKDTEYESPHEYQAVRKSIKKRYRCGEWKLEGLLRYNDLIMMVMDTRGQARRKDWEERNKTTFEREVLNGKRMYSIEEDEDDESSRSENGANKKSATVMNVLTLYAV